MHSRKELVEGDEVAGGRDYMEFEDDDIGPLAIHEPVKWNEERNFISMRLIMFGAFYPNYFTRSTNIDVEQMANSTLLGKAPKNTVYMHGMDEEQARFGALYAGQIKKLFKDCTKEEDKIKLTFEGRKIYVEFDRALGDTERSMMCHQADQGWNMTETSTRYVELYYLSWYCKFSFLRFMLLLSWPSRAPSRRSCS